jgi:hypothetical protein
MTKFTLRDALIWLTVAAVVAWAVSSMIRQAQRPPLVERGGKIVPPAERAEGAKQR